MRAIHRVRAYDRGYSAYLSTRPNPYQGSVLRSDWHSGLMDAEGVRLGDEPRSSALRHMYRERLRRGFITMTKETYHA